MNKLREFLKFDKNIYFTLKLFIFKYKFQKLNAPESNVFIYRFRNDFKQTFIEFVRKLSILRGV